MALRRVLGGPTPNIHSWVPPLGSLHYSCPTKCQTISCAPLGTLWRQPAKLAHGRAQERLGFEPRHIVDVGAHVGNWTRDAREAARLFDQLSMQIIAFIAEHVGPVRCGLSPVEVFPSADFLLIEANPEHADKLRNTGEAP